MNVGSIGSSAVGSDFKSRYSYQPPIQSTAGDSDKVTLSDAAKALLGDVGSAAEEKDMQKKLEAIKSKPAVERTPAETEYVNSNDARLKEIQLKSRSGGPESLTSDELSYMQKAGGFVNTMANLSSEEKALYDELVSSGNYDAAQGLRNIALGREGMGGQQVTLPNGRTFDPLSTELTGDTVRNLYKFMFVDPSGASDRAFNALATALDQRRSE